MAIGSGRGRCLKASWERVFGCGVVASIPRKIRLDLASIWSQGDPDFRRDFCHDRATIGPQSGVNHDARASSIACRSMEDESAPIPRQNLLDRGSIGLRSCSSAMFHRRPMKRQKNGRLDHDQAASLFDDDPTLLAAPRGVR